MESWKILLFRLISLSLVISSSTSVHNVKRASACDPKTYVMIFNQKIDLLTGRVDQMEANRNETLDVHEIIANITRSFVQFNNEHAKKFEEKFENIEGNLKKLNRMELILLELKNASYHRNKERDDVCGGVTSLCEDKVATWANATSMQLKANLDRIDFCIRNELKALNACHPNPCLHGGRCRLNSTGRGYNCECPKFRSGSLCENVECSVEKLCFRFKDTLYVVIETKLPWAKAKGMCESLNMTLAMPKDEERTQFLWNRLRPIYTTFPHDRLWMGLKRDAGMSEGQWAWVDGSALGEYTGYKGMKSTSGSWFGQLYTAGDGSNMWGYSSAANQYYSICETRHFAN